MHVGDEPVVVETVTIHRHLQFLFNNTRSLLNDGTIVDVRCGFRLCLVVDKMQGDGGGFLLRKGDIQPLFQDVQCLFSNLGFFGIKLAHLVKERQLDVDVFAVALNGKINVICQREHHVLPELVVHLLVGKVYDLGGGFQHIFRDAVEHGQLFLVHIVKGAVDFGKWYIIGWLCETNAFPEGYHLVVAAVQTKGDVVIDVFNDLHLPTTPIERKNPKVHPYLQWIRESLRRVTNLT